MWVSLLSPPRPVHEEQIRSPHRRGVGVDVLVGRDDRRVDPDHAGEIRRSEPVHELSAPRGEVDALEAAGDFRQAIDEDAAAVGRPAGDEVVRRERETGRPSPPPSELYSRYWSWFPWTRTSLPSGETNPTRSPSSVTGRGLPSIS